jgi:hypothetical protein
MSLLDDVRNLVAGPAPENMARASKAPTTPTPAPSPATKAVPLPPTAATSAGSNNPSVEQIRRIALEIGLKLTPADFAAIEELQARHEAIVAKMIGLAGRAPADHYHRLQDQQEKAALEGRDIPKLPTLEEVRADHMQKIKALKGAQKTIAAQTWELIKDKPREFFVAAEALATKIEADDISFASKFGVAYEPSSVVKMIRQAGRSVLAQAASFSPNCGASPRTIASFLPLPEQP